MGLSSLLLGNTTWDRCRSRSLQSFILGSSVLAIGAAVYARFLIVLADNDARQFLYLATGTNVLEERGPVFLAPILSIATFVAMALLIFSVLRLGTSAMLAFLGAAIFITSAQVGLVFMSAPLWDMATYLAPLAALLIALLMIIAPEWSTRTETTNLTMALIWTIKISTALAVLLILVAIARGLRMIISGEQTLAVRDGSFVLQLLIAFCLLIILSAAAFKLPKWMGSSRVSRKDLLLVGLSLSMAAVILFAPLINSRRAYSSSASIIMLVLVTAPLFAPVAGRLKLRLGLTGALLGVLFISSLGVGTVTTSNLAFYLASGWQSAPQLVSGLMGSSVQLGIPFTDSHLVTFVDIQGLSPLAFLVSLGPMFLYANIEYANIGLHYLVAGTWAYPEPPPGADGILWAARMWVIGSIGWVAAFAVLAAILMLLVSHRRVALFLIALIAVVLVLIGMSRPQMHQWWFLPIFGVWAFLYSGRRGFLWIRGGGSGRTSTLTSPIPSTMHSVHVNVLLRTVAVSIVLIMAVQISDRVTEFVSSRTQIAALQIQNRAAEEQLGQYSNLMWSSIPPRATSESESTSLTLFRSFETPTDISLVRVQSRGACNLNGLQFAMRRDGLFAGETQRFFVGNTPSTTAYLPVIAGESSAINELTVQGPDPNCLPTVAVARVMVGALPILSWLPSRCEDVSTKSGTCPSGMWLGQEGRSIEPPYSFEGYVVPASQEPPRDSLKPSPPTTVSGRVLGLPNHGYGASDLRVSAWRQTSTDSSVYIAGSITRGSVIIGVEFEQNVGTRNLVPLTNYAIDGSVFNRGTSKFGHCFDVPAGLPYRLYVGTITDLYSPSWIDLKLDGVSESLGNCESSSNTPQWKPTLS